MSTWNGHPLHMSWGGNYGPPANYRPQEHDFSLLDQLLADLEPSAVDRLAALVDPDGEAAQRVAAWERTKANARDLEQIRETQDLVDRATRYQRYVAPAPAYSETIGLTFTTSTGSPPLNFESTTGGAHIHVGTSCGGRLILK